MVDYGSAPVYFVRRRSLVVPALPTDVTISDCAGLVRRWPFVCSEIVFSVRRWLFCLPCQSLALNVTILSCGTGAALELFVRR